tara:strand:- start:447 stop:2285 length:1839 start_codon:yes stop_codon:yes gene_type:complete
VAAEWKPYQIAAAGEIQTLADSAAALATTVKETLTLANTAMEVVKLLAQLQTINPLLMALDALAEEILKQIANLKEAGYYYLYVDPYFIKNVTPEPAFTYGFEQLRDEGGKLLWLTDEVETSSVPTQAQLEAKTSKPFLATPRKLVPGGYNPYVGSTTDPLSMISPYPKFSTKQVVEEFRKAFEDEGDVPRYKALASAPKTGTIVYDKSGDPYSGWDTTKDFGIELFDIGQAQEDGSTVKDFTAARKAVNNKISSGKPNIQGQTEFDAGSGAIAIIIAAPSFDVFTDTFNAFSKMFTDIPEFAAATGKSLFDSFADILTPANTEIKLTQVDTNYGKFEVGDVIGGKIYGGQAEIVAINSSSVVATTMSTRKETRLTDDARQVVSFMEVVDTNPDGRWVDMVVTGKPIRSADGLNPFIWGDDVYEMEKRGEYGTGGSDLFPNYVIKGLNTVTLPVAKRIYPKTGKVGMEKLAVLPDSTPPDFGAIQMKDIVPGWGEFFQILENFVKQLQGMISDSAAFIQDMIDMIKGIEKFLEELVKTIEEFLAFFSITLPSTGVYALRIPNQTKGNDGLKSDIAGASGLPDLAYAAGILFVGTEIAGVNPIDLLATFLKID